jgi:hypothetical protein
MPGTSTDVARDRRWLILGVYVNLIFAGGALLLKRQPSQGRPRLDVPSQAPTPQAEPSQDRVR